MRYSGAYGPCGCHRYSQVCPKSAQLIYTGLWHQGLLCEAFGTGLSVNKTIVSNADVVNSKVKYAESSNKRKRRTCTDCLLKYMVHRRKSRGIRRGEGCMAGGPADGIAFN